MSEVDDLVCERVGRLERQRVTARQPDRMRPRGSSCDLDADGVIASVLAAGHDKHRDLQIGQVVPQWRHRSLSEGGQLMGEALRRRPVDAGVESGSFDRQRREERLSDPPGEEVCNAGPRHVLGESLIGSRPGGTLGRIGDSRCRTDEHQSFDQIGPIDRESQSQATAHGVADVHRTTTRGTEAGRGVDETEAVTDVERDGVEPDNLGLDRTEDVVPNTRRLGETGNEPHSHDSMFA